MLYTMEKNGIIKKCKIVYTIIEKTRLLQKETILMFLTVTLKQDCTQKIHLSSF